MSFLKLVVNSLTCAFHIRGFYSNNLRHHGLTRFLQSVYPLILLRTQWGDSAISRHIVKRRGAS